MKNLFFLFAFIALSLGSATAQTADEKAIRQAIEAESKAYHTNPDRMAFTAYWHVTPETRIVYSGPEASSVFVGSEMKAAIDSGQMPPMDHAINEYSNFVIRASGPIGWASFDQKSTTPDGKVSTMREMRLMEKIGDAWKIVFSSVHEYKQ
jgi:hypothetical protein